LPQNRYSRLFLNTDAGISCNGLWVCGFDFMVNLLQITVDYLLRDLMSLVLNSGYMLESEYAISGLEEEPA